MGTIYASEQRLGKYFQSKESLLRWYLSNAPGKLAALGYLIKHIYNNKFLNIISLGAKACVLEYLLKCSLPMDAHVVAMDYSPFFIQKAQKLLPNIIAMEFDFFKDDILDVNDRLGIRFDIAVFLGSIYVMDDLQFIHLFKQLKEIGVKQIIDFYGGYLTWKTIMYNLLEPLRKIKVMRKILRRPPLPDCVGKFHGYGRSRGELRRLYTEAGLSLVKETRVGDYHYVAVLSHG